MAHLDGLEENDGILVVVTTNRIEEVEKAVVDRPGRIDSKIFMGELGQVNIARLLGNRLDNFKCSFESFSDVIPKGTVYTGAMVMELATGVMREVVRRDCQGELVIIKDDVVRALKVLERNENSRTRMGFDGID